MCGAARVRDRAALLGHGDDAGRPRARGPAPHPPARRPQPRLDAGPARRGVPAPRPLRPLAGSSHRTDGAWQRGYRAGGGGVSDDSGVAGGPKVGFVGTGTMGDPMASNLMKAGAQLTVNDLSRASTAHLVEEGGVWAHTPAE